MIDEEELDTISAEDSDDIDDTEDKYFSNKRNQLKTLTIKKLSWTINDIYEKYLSGNLNLQPFYQRKAVWKSRKQTQFIESLIIGILTPPIYIAQLNEGSLIGKPTYEVVDGQQRLRAILYFFGLLDDRIKKSNTPASAKAPQHKKLRLDKRGLVYYRDILGEKTYDDIVCENPEIIKKISSYTIDFYLITRETSPDIKYDIFARLNQEAVPLSEAELRRSIYYSPLTTEISKKYDEIALKFPDKIRTSFTKNDLKHFNDYNRMFKSFAYFFSYDKDNVSFTNYNSRPKELINLVLEKYQQNSSKCDHFDRIDKLIESTINYKVFLKLLPKSSLPDPAPSIEYVLDSLIPFYEKLNSIGYEKVITELYKNDDFLSTFKKSPSTTSNVKSRLTVIVKVLYELESQYIDH